MVSVLLAKHVLKDDLIDTLILHTDSRLMIDRGCNNERTMVEGQ